MTQPKEPTNWQLEELIDVNRDFFVHLILDLQERVIELEKSVYGKSKSREN